MTTPDTATLTASVYIERSNDWSGTPTLVNDTVNRRIYVTGLERNLGGSDLNAPVVDPFSPGYGFSPANGSTNVPLDTHLVVTFNEDIAVGTGFVTVKNLSDATEVDIDITDGLQVSTSGAVLTISPSVGLDYDDDYAVQIDAGAIVDLATAPNSFAGISDDTTWAFTAPSLPVGILFSDNFENPDVDPSYWLGGPFNNQFTSQQVDGTKWIRAAGLYGGGIVDEGENGGANFAAPEGVQAYGTRGNGDGVTTVDAVISRLWAGFTYTVTFDVVEDGADPWGPVDGTPYNVGLVTFAPGANRSSINPSQGGMADGTSAVLASASGNASGSPATVTFSYTADGTEATLGDDLAVRIDGDTGSAIIDNVIVTGAYATVGNDFGTWIGDPAFGLAPEDQDANDDPDGDDLDNLLEAFFGTNPSVSNAGLTQIGKSGNTVTFQHPEADPALADVTGTYEWSLDMQNWNASGDTVSGVQIDIPEPPAPVAGITTVTANITTGDPVKLFLRVVATQNP